MHVLPAARLSDLMELLDDDGYEVIGPALRNGAIDYVPVRRARDLPLGVTDEQAPGHYRTSNGGSAYCGCTAAGQSWKRQTYRPDATIFHTERTPDGLRFRAADTPGRPMAFLGVRACEVAALRIQDRVFDGGDVDYSARRDGALIIGVNCASAGGTCFCTSMGTGPQLEEGFDLALTEITEGEHRFVVEAGTDKGAAILERLDLEGAGDADSTARQDVLDACLASFTKTFEETGTRELLQANPLHPQWDDVATRCLACGSCTMVCPTCFCSEHEEVTGLDGTIEHRRRWESCFSIEFSTLHGHAVRSSVGSRYRQWLTHKLAHWYDQFGTSGCVGCGRCITWCPVGIDLTKEVEAIREGVLT